MAEPGGRIVVEPGGRIPVTVVGGYLGAGKTTLVNHLLRAGGERRLAVLVNDLGAVSIDADLIASADATSVTLANGCICCTLTDGFAEALAALAARAGPPPGHVVVEASGVADPAQVAAYADNRTFRLDGVVVLADAETIVARSRDRYVGATVTRQVAAADLVVLTKVDLVERAAAGRAAAWATGVAPGVPVVEGTPSSLGIDTVLGPLAPGGNRAGGGGGAGAPAPHATHTAVTLQFDAPITGQALSGYLLSLPASVVRAKGVVTLTGSPGAATVVHLVGRRLTFEAAPAPGRAGAGRAGPGRSALVLVAVGGLDAGAVAAAFRAATGVGPLSVA